MKSYQVIRTDISPYQSQDFLSQEETIISGLGPFIYRTLKNFSDQETILITNTHTRLRELPAALLKKTKLIIHPNSGYDHFESDHELWQNIPLVVGHTIRAQAVAEYSLGAVFEGLVELPQHLSWNEKRNWNRTLLKGTSVWIFGHGHIGKIIADTLKALGMKVTIVDPYKEGALASWKEGDISQARVIIAAVGLNQQTRLMFNQDFFSKLGEKVLFINGARGKLVEEKALKDYLLSHPEAFAFLDVFPNEPFGEDWIGFPQVWKTSHIAGVEKDLDQKILEFEVEVLKDYQTLSEAEFFKKYSKELLQNKWIKGVLI
jgi:D-3-phosphoglycerate dehydrogenase